MSRASSSRLLRSRPERLGRAAPVLPLLQHFQPLELEPPCHQLRELLRAARCEAGEVRCGRLQTLPVNLEIDRQQPGAGQVEGSPPLLFGLGLRCGDLLPQPVEQVIERGQGAPLALHLEPGEPGPAKIPIRWPWRQGVKRLSARTPRSSVGPKPRR